MDSAKDYSTKGDELYAKGEYDDAIKQYDLALDIDPTLSKAHFYKGACYHQLKQYQDALKCYEAAIEFDPNYAAAHHYRGTILDTLGRYEEAMAPYEKSLELISEDNSQYILWLCNIGIAASKLGRDEQALKLLDKANDRYSQVNQIGHANDIYQKRIEQALLVNRVELLKKLKQASIEKDDNSDLNEKEQNISSQADKVLDQNATNKTVEKLIEDLEALKIEISNVKKVLNYDEAVQKKADLAEITNPIYNDYLYQYYKTFNVVFSEAVLGFRTASSGFIEQKSELNSVAGVAASLGAEIPWFDSLFNTMKASLLQYNESNPQKEIKDISMISLNTIEMDEMAEYAARKITLDEDKKEEILSVSAKPSKKFVKFFSKWNDIIFLSHYNTAPKKMAFKDASILLLACIVGVIDPSKKPDKIRDDFVKVVVRGKFEDDLLDFDDALAAKQEKLEK